MGINHGMTVAVIAIALPFAACHRDSRKAREMLDQAYSLADNYKPEAERKIIIEVITRYGHTAEGTEARRMLAELDQSVNKWFKTGISGFRSECGRPPTEEEGLKALFDNPGIKCWHGPYLPDIFAHMAPGYDSRTGTIIETKP
jgi:hypothetical protein